MCEIQLFKKDKQRWRHPPLPMQCLQIVLQDLENKLNNSEERVTCPSWLYHFGTICMA